MRGVSVFVLDGVGSTVLLKKLPIIFSPKLFYLRRSWIDCIQVNVLHLNATLYIICFQ